MKPQPSVVVFSDVDGVFRDPGRPALAAAEAAIRELAREDVALVLCSGRTRAELESIQQMLGIGDPYICENGAAVFIPDGYFSFGVTGARELAGYQAVEFGGSYPEVVETLHRTAARLGIEVVGFSDLSIEEVARECGLPLLQARLAKLRDYEERFRLVDPNPSARSRLAKALHGEHLRCLEGEGFDYVGGMVDRHLGVNLLSGLYRRERGSVFTVGVTDALQADNLAPLVDHAITVLGEEVASGSIGVADWAEAIVESVQDIRRRVVAAGPRAAV